MFRENSQLVRSGVVLSSCSVFTAAVRTKKSIGCSAAVWHQQRSPTSTVPTVATPLDVKHEGKSNVTEASIPLPQGATLSALREPHRTQWMGTGLCLQASILRLDPRGKSVQGRRQVINRYLRISSENVPEIRVPTAVILSNPPPLHLLQARRWLLRDSCTMSHLDFQKPSDRKPAHTSASHSNI